MWRPFNKIRLISWQETEIMSEQFVNFPEILQLCAELEVNKNQSVVILK